MSEDQLKKLLNTLGADLNSDLLETCIKECLGEDFRNPETRVNDDEEKTGGSDDERKTSDDESSDDESQSPEEKLAIEKTKKELEEFTSKLSEELKKVKLTDLGNKISKIKGIGNQLNLQRYLKKYIEIMEDDTETLTLDSLDKIARDNPALKDINKLLTGDELLAYMESLSEIFKKNIKQYLENKDSAFGKLLRKSTEKVRRIAKKKGIYIIGRKNRKFLGIKFLKSGSYSKKKNKKPNCKEYSYDQIRRMKKTKYKINWKKSKLPELIEKMNIKDVKRKFGDFQFGFELLSKRGCSNFGYTFPKGATRGYGSTLLYSQI